MRRGGQMRSTRPRKAEAWGVPAPAVVEAIITEVQADGAVRVTTSAGERLLARCPQHVDPAWLRAALQIAPVEGAVVVPEGGRRAILWAVFPGPEHQDVRVEFHLRATQIVLEGQSVELRTGKAKIALDTEGIVQIRGKQVHSRAAGVYKI